MPPLAHIAAAALLVALAAPAGGAAESVLAARTIPARSVIAMSDMRVVTDAIPGSLADPAGAVGQEAQVTIYEGRPVRAVDIGPPALVERNEIVALLFNGGGLRILTDGRALERAGAGQRVRVMNLDSRVTVTGTVTGPGQISVP